MSYGTVDPAYAQRLATIPSEDDGPVWMVNLMDYRNRAVYPDGTDHGLSGREADDIYAPFAVLAEIGAQIVFVGEVTEQLLGPAPRWDRVAIVRYPTRRSFIEMQARPDFLDRHVHKEAGMASTIIMGGSPLPIFEVPGSTEWADVPHPPTPDDGPVVVIHVIRWADGGREVMTGYEMAAAQKAAPHGVQVAGWFDVEGTVVGDGRAWDQVRLNAFPSRRAFEAVLTDPDRLAAQHAYREPAMADTYALILRPVFDLTVLSDAVAQDTSVQ